MAGTPRPDAPVLCGIDHEAAWQVVAVAANLAVALGTRLHVLHAVPAPVPEGLTLAARGQEARARERARTRGGELLDELRAELDGVPADLELVDLPPAIALPRRAAELDAAAVVVGTRARGRLADLALGSVSAAVVRDADRPVVVVPPDGVAGLRRGAPVVVGVDGSREAQAAVRAAGDLTAALGGELVLLHVLEDGTAGSAIAAAAGPLDDGGEPPSVAQQALRRAATWVDLDVQLVPRLRRGPVVGELLAECEERGAAALALAPRRRGPAAAALLGSVTREAVRRATVPVLVVRGG